MLRDIRQAIRLLAKNPGFTAIAALSLAIGIGANSAVFSLADALLLRPLPVEDPSGVLSVSTDTPDNSFGGTSFPNYRDFRDKSQTFTGLAAFDFYTFGFATSPTVQPQMRMGFLVSDNFFQVLRIQPALGRAFLPEEAKVPGRDAIAVLSYDLWANQFGRDRSVIGRIIRLNGIDFTVIGVAPESFTGMDPFIRPALYAPLSMSQRISAAAKNPLEDRSAAGLQLRGRLKPGVSREQAQAELIAIAKYLEKAYPDTNRNHSAVVRTELQARFEQDPYDSALAIMLMALVGLVLLIACANVANLLLSRAGARSREIAIRLAIGISRARLVRQLLTESMILALFGGTLGLGLAYFGIRFLKGLPVPTDLPVVIGVQLDQCAAGQLARRRRERTDFRHRARVASGQNRSDRRAPLSGSLLQRPASYIGTQCAGHWSGVLFSGPVSRCRYDLRWLPQSAGDEPWLSHRPSHADGIRHSIGSLHG